MRFIRFKRMCLKYLFCYPHRTYLDEYAVFQPVIRNVFCAYSGRLSLPRQPRHKVIPVPSMPGRRSHMRKMGQSYPASYRTQPCCVFSGPSISTRQASMRVLEKLQVGIEHVSPADFTFVVLGDSRDNDGIFKKHWPWPRPITRSLSSMAAIIPTRGAIRETDHFPRPGK